MNNLGAQYGETMRVRKPRKPRVRPEATTAGMTGPHPWAFLSAWRVNAGLTLDAVAAQFGISSPTIHRYETGETPVTVQTWFRLAELYGATHPSELFWPPAERDQ